MLLLLLLPLLFIWMSGILRRGFWHFLWLGCTAQYNLRLRSEEEGSFAAALSAVSICFFFCYFKKSLGVWSCG
ncbi:hypothetical protein BZA77DRAFT_302828 [Pyronema omphalodes]|nr:hypothetical protein BZA77DRAFT_302828 [Pyronema omphalodes]